MELRVINPGFEYMLNGIMEFQKEDTTGFWSKPLYHFYPQLDREYAAGLNLNEKRKYFENTLGQVYEELEPLMKEKVALYSGHWEKCKPQITAALSEAFGIDCENKFNDMECRISMDPVVPRYLTEQAFDMFYLNSEKGFIGIAIHEMIHFVWFYVWNEVFGDSYEEYEAPSLKWILSEMVVESIMKDDRLSSLNPYFERSRGGCIYPYFFDMKVKGSYVLPVLDEMYRTQSITDFMKNSYEYCLKNEAEIREHIRKSEEQA